MLEVAAAITTIGVLLCVAIGAVARASGVRPKPASATTLSLTTSSWARRRVLSATPASSLISTSTVLPPAFLPFWAWNRAIAAAICLPVDALWPVIGRITPIFTVSAWAWAAKGAARALAQARAIRWRRWGMAELRLGWVSGRDCGQRAHHLRLGLTRSARHGCSLAAIACRHEPAHEGAAGRRRRQSRDAHREACRPRRRPGGPAAAARRPLPADQPPPAPEDHRADRGGGGGAVDAAAAAPRRPPAPDPGRDAHALQARPDPGLHRRPGQRRAAARRARRQPMMILSPGAGLACSGGPIIHA